MAIGKNARQETFRTTAFQSQVIDQRAAECGVKKSQMIRALLQLGLDKSKELESTKFIEYVTAIDFTLGIIELNNKGIVTVQEVVDAGKTVKTELDE